MSRRSDTHHENNGLEAITLLKFPDYRNCNGSVVVVRALVSVIGPLRVLFTWAAGAARLHSAFDSSGELEVVDLLIRKILAAFTFALVGGRLVFAGHVEEPEVKRPLLGACSGKLRLLRSSARHGRERGHWQ